MQPASPLPSRRAGACAALAVLLSVLATSADAQLRGTVLDAEGKPVAGVAVEVWSPYRQLAVRASDDAGAFRFSAEEARGAGGLFARRAGWQTAYRGIPRGDTLVVVRMEREPETLPGLTVRAAPVPCSNRDDPRARALWTALRDRYRGGTDTTTVVAYYQWVASLAPPGQSGPVDTIAATRGWIKSVQDHRRMWRHRISIVGYGIELRESLDQAYAGWMYPPLQSHYPTHFVEDLFGDRHVFTAVRAGEGTTLLRFCPRQQSSRRPRIEGTLTVAADGALVRAAWSYATPEPREDAGAEVDFAPASPGHSLLLPAASLYWRRTTGGKYYRQWARYADWRIAGQDAMPDSAEWRRP